MGKILVLAEKPSVGRDIARVLGCTNKCEGYITGEKYIVTWCIGHLVQLYEPEDYDKKYKTWSMDNLPIIPEVFKLKAASGTSKQFNIVKKLMNSSEVDSIICATDAGREGELIFRYTYALAKCNKPFNRLWISSMTDAAIKKGFMDIKPGTDYDCLYSSAKCRSESDWLVGMNASRAFSLVYNSKLSIGRVQTPTLAIIVNRHFERENFKAENYYEVCIKYDGFTGTWYNESAKDTKIKDKSHAQAIADKVKGKEGIVKDIKNEPKKELPPQLFDLTELQRASNRRYGFSASKTLNIVQNLYEKKLVTYPRTDSKYISEDIVPTLMDRVNSVRKPEFTSVTSYIEKLQDLNMGKRYVDNKKVSDHHAILPTEQPPRPGSMSADEEKIYDIIARRFLSMFMPPYEYTVTTLLSTVEGEAFISKGKTVQRLGWKYLYDNDATEGKKAKEESLPSLNMGDSLKNKGVKVEEKQTKPPALYNEATLLSAMENAGRFVEDEELKEQLKEGGLGTPATRAGIIERLIKVGYIKREKKNLIPTEKGINLISIVPDNIKSPELTGSWEKALSLMAKGQYDPKAFMDSIKEYSISLINEAKSCTKAVHFEREFKKKTPAGKCPACGAPVMENSKGWSCSAWKTKNCKFTIWKEDKFLARYNKTVTATMAKSLLKSGTAEAKGLTNPRTQEKFDSIVKLVHSNGYWNIVLADESVEAGGSTPSVKKEPAPVKAKVTPTEYTCPVCRKNYLSFSDGPKFKGWGCHGWKDGCKFSIPFQLYGVNLEKYVPQISSKGSTDVINDFISKDGKPFSARLKAKNGRLELEVLSK